MLHGKPIITAALYGVATKALNQATRRNQKRFPKDFMFRLTAKEDDFLRSQIVTSKPRRGGRRYPPYAFTEYGAVMLAAVLNSDAAVAASIQIVRAFVRLREILASHKNLAKRLEAVEKRLLGHDVELGVQAQEIKAVLEAIRQLAEPPPEPPLEKLKTVAGFKP
jgi:ORF6N domain